jgi:hypothetical protein
MYKTTGVYIGKKNVVFNFKDFFLRKKKLGFDPWGWLNHSHGPRATTTPRPQGKWGWLNHSLNGQNLIYFFIFFHFGPWGWPSHPHFGQGGDSATPCGPKGWLSHHYNFFFKKKKKRKKP